MRLRLKRNAGEHTANDGTVFKAGDIYDTAKYGDVNPKFMDKFEPLMVEARDPEQLVADVDNSPPRTNGDVTGQNGTPGQEVNPGPADLPPEAQPPAQKPPPTPKPPAPK